jgi:hypothetical protein
MRRRFTMLGLGALTVASLALAACGTSNKTNASGTPSASTSSASVAPAVALANAVTALKDQGFDVTAKEGTLSGNGTIDPSNKAGTIEIKGTQQGVAIDVSFTEIGTDAWAKVDLGALSSQLGINPTKWMKLDLSKMTGKDAMPFDLSSGDALELGKLITSVSDVKRTDATHLSGTIDLSAATGPNAPDAAAVQKAGAAAKAVPFTATLDSQGRLSELKVNGDTDLALDFQLTNFGSPSKVTQPPASDVIPAPAGIYQFFNSNG